MLLMFDVNQPQTLEALRKWWDDFRDKAPVPDDEVDRFCCVFVGNKIDVLMANGNIPTGANLSGSSSRIREEQALTFMHELIPPPPPPVTRSPSLEHSLPSQDTLTSSESSVTFSIFTPSPPRTHSIDIGVYHPRRKTSRSRSRSTLFRGSTVGTMTTTHTLSVYHTPTSSIFDTFESARSSPVRISRISTPSQSRSPSASPVRAARRQPSLSSMLSDAQTITPSLYGRSNGDTRSTAPARPTATPPTQGHSLPTPSPPELGAKLFFTSAKTGEGVSDVFEYVAQRVVRRWEYEEAMEARTLHMADASMNTIRLQHSNDSRIWHGTSCCQL